MTHGSLFSGIGGFDYAARCVGWDNTFYCDIDDFCRKVLEYHFPNSVGYQDIKNTSFNEWKEKIDVLTGGFPCQPFSVAGKRRGTDDNRYLWKEMFRAIKEIQPSWIVAENVPGIISWSRGMVFEEVCSDMESEGYSVQPIILPAASIGAPHRRDRVWIIAHSNDREQQEQQRSDTKGQEKSSKSWSGNRSHSGDGNKQQNITERVRSVESDTKVLQRYVPEYECEECEKDWRELSFESSIRSRDDGVSIKLDGVTFPSWRKDSIRCYGNAIVPQVAIQIFKTINDYESIYIRKDNRRNNR